MYADDIVLIADSELKFEALSTRLGQCCKQWGLVISASKWKVIHFQKPKVLRGQQQYFCVVKLI